MVRGAALGRLRGDRWYLVAIAAAVLVANLPYAVLVANLPYVVGAADANPLNRLELPQPR